RFLHEREAEAAQRFPRQVGLEPRFAELVPEIVLDLTPEQFAALAARTLAPKVPEVVNVSHLHAPAVSVAEQLLLVRNHLARAGTASFRALTADCDHTLEVVARFLALLELYRQQRVGFEQLTPLGERNIRERRAGTPGRRAGPHLLGRAGRGAVGDPAGGGEPGGRRPEHLGR